MGTGGLGAARRGVDTQASVTLFSVPLKCSTVKKKQKLQRTIHDDCVEHASLPVHLDPVGSGPGLLRGAE